MERDKKNQKPLSDLKEIEIKRFSFIQSWRIFILEAFLFSLTLSFGIANALRLNKLLKIQKIPLPQISFWQFLFNFLLATLFIFLIIRFLRLKKEKETIFKMIFVLAVALGGLAFLEVWLSQPISFIAIIFLIFWWWEKPLVLNHDILMILGLAGVGSILGLALETRVVLIILIIFSIYDYIAVYKTKHMIKMAKEMIEQKAILAFIIPFEFSGFKKNLSEVRPGGNFLILGGGDVVFPLLFSTSLISTGILNSIIVALFSLIGLFAGFYFFIKQKVRQPIPALPPIAFFSIIGYLIICLI